LADLQGAVFDELRIGERKHTRHVLSGPTRSGRSWRARSTGTAARTGAIAGRCADELEYVGSTLGGDLHAGLQHPPCISRSPAQDWPLAR
jgi:hypothetical protein